MLVQTNVILQIEEHMVLITVISATEETPQPSIIRAAPVAQDFIAAIVNTEVTKDAMFAMDVHITSTSVTQCFVRDLVYTCDKN